MPRRQITPATRPAAVSPRTLNVLILVCAGLIGCAYLIALLNQGPEGLGASILALLSLGALFAALESLVILRLGRPVVEAVARWSAPGAARVLLTVLALLALVASVVVFFFTTCYAMVQRV